MQIMFSAPKRRLSAAGFRHARVVSAALEYGDLSLTRLLAAVAAISARHPVVDGRTPPSLPQMTPPPRSRPPGPTGERRGRTSNRNISLAKRMIFRRGQGRRRRIRHRRQGVSGPGAEFRRANGTKSLNESDTKFNSARGITVSKTPPSPIPSPTSISSSPHLRRSGGGYTDPVNSPPIC